MKTDYSKEFLSIILLVLIASIFTSLMLGSMIVVENFFTIKNSAFYFIGYLAILFGLYYLSNKIKSKFLTYLLLLISLPFSILYVSFTVAFPFITLVLHMFLYIMFSLFIPIIFYSIQSRGLFPLINHELAVYILITASAIISVLCHRQILYLVHATSPARLKTSEKLRPYKIEELSIYLLSENNIKFGIYLVYFIFLVVINVYNLQRHNFFSTFEIDKDILQSFATFLAFDRVTSHMKQLKFKPSELLIKISNSIANKVKDSNNSR